MHCSSCTQLTREVVLHKRHCGLIVKIVHARPNCQHASGRGSCTASAVHATNPLGLANRHPVKLHALPETNLDISKVAELIASGPLEPEREAQLKGIAAALGVPLGSVKQMAYKRRALLTLSPEEVLEKVQQLSSILEVPQEQAKAMVAIQPGLLFETQKQADALAMGIRAICYELNAPKEEVVDLILKNQSVLHGREMHLSVADIAHLAMLREPKGRIVEE